MERSRLVGRELGRGEEDPCREPEGVGEERLGRFDRNDSVLAGDNVEVTRASWTRVKWATVCRTSRNMWSGSWSIRLRASESVCGLDFVLRSPRCPPLLSLRGCCRRERRLLSMGGQVEEGMVGMRVGGAQRVTAVLLEGLGREE